MHETLKRGRTRSVGALQPSRFHALRRRAVVDSNTLGREAWMYDKLVAWSPLMGFDNR
jgi:hypothetical protein